MNNTRRNEIKKVVERIYKLQELAEEIKNDLECIKDEEEDYRDNMPENLQESDRYYASEEASENLEESIDILDTIINELTDSAESAESATE